MANNMRPMALSFIGSPEHMLSRCIHESRFNGVKQLFPTMHKFGNEVLDTYCPSRLQNVEFGEFIQVVKEAHPTNEIVIFSEEKNHYITVKEQAKNITYCLYCVYDEPENLNPRTHYYLVALEREHKLSDAIRPHIDREIAITAWKDYLKVLDEAQEVARAF